MRKDLSDKCWLSKAVISRIYRDTNEKNASYIPSISVWQSICVGLKLERKEAENLYFSAYPELEYFDYFLEKKMSINEANEMLYDNGLPLIGNTND